MQAAFLHSSSSARSWSPLRSWCTSSLPTSIAMKHTQSSSMAHSHIHGNTLRWASINATWHWGLCVGVCDCLCRKAWSTCVIYRGFSMQHISSPMVTGCVYLCLSHLTFVLVSQKPPLIVLLLCSQISLCHLHLFSPPLLFSDTLSLYDTKQGLRQFNHLLYWLLGFVPKVFRSTHGSYLEYCHTGRPQLPLWNGDPECPLQARLEIHIAWVLCTLTSGPVLGQASV